MRLIDADALIKNILKSDSYNDYEWSLYADEIIDDKINAAPTIEPKRGEWKRRIVDNGFNADWVCSECGYRVKTDFVDYNFCPNCGADMRKGADDEQ